MAHVKINLPALKTYSLTGDCAPAVASYGLALKGVDGRSYTPQGCPACYSLPFGHNYAIEVIGKDSTGTAIPGAKLYAGFDVTSASSTVNVGWNTTGAGRVLFDLVGINPEKAASINRPSLTTLLSGTHGALVKSGAVASALSGGTPLASINPDAAAYSYQRIPVEVTLNNLVNGLPVTLCSNDPTSAPLTFTAEGTSAARIMEVTPPEAFGVSSWTLKGKLADNPVRSIVLDPSLGAQSLDVGDACRPTILADSFASIQAAINSLPACGGSVYLAPHIYAITTPLVIPSHVELIGQSQPDGSGGWISSVLHLENGANASVITNQNLVSGDTGIRLADFKIDGNRAGQSTLKHLIYLAHVSGSTVEGLTVENGIGSGLQATYCDNNTIRNNHFNNNGLTLSWATSGINLNDHCLNNLVEANTCSHNNPAPNETGAYDGNGIRIGDYSNDNILRDNRCDHNGRRGIKVQGGHNLITNNTLLNNLGQSLGVHGIVESNGIRTVDGNQILNNTITAVNDAGIYLTASSNSVVSGNTITGTLYGIQIGDAATGATYSSDGNIVSNNIVQNTIGQGIFIRGSSDNTISGNTVKNSGTVTVRADGIRLVNSGGRSSINNQITGNICQDDRPAGSKTQRYGLGIDPGPDWTTVTSNDFRGNALLPGLSLSGSHNTVADNLTD